MDAVVIVDDAEEEETEPTPPAEPDPAEDVEPDPAEDVDTEALAKVAATVGAAVAETVGDAVSDAYQAQIDTLEADKARAEVEAAVADMRADLAAEEVEMLEDDLSSALEDQAEPAPIIVEGPGAEVVEEIEPAAGPVDITPIPEAPADTPPLSAGKHWFFMSWKEIKDKRKARRA